MTDIQNPYTPPTSRVEDMPGTSGPEQATLGLRFANVFLDGIALYVVNIVIVISVGAIGGLTAIRQMQGGISMFMGLFVAIAYYILMESILGRTLGKYVTGTRVVDERGGKPSMPQILGRTLARYVPFEAFSFFREGGLGWHDTWSRTKVVKVR